MGLIIIWFAVFPFILLYGAYEGPKVFWLWIGGFFLTIWWIFRIVQSNIPNIDRRIRWFLLWLTVLLVASIAGVHPVDSIVGGSYRHQGVLFFFTLFLLWITLIQFTLREKHVFQKLLALGVSVESVYVLLQKISVWSARPLGSLGEPNAVAGFLAVGLFFIATADFSKRIRILLYIIAVCAIAATGSRTGIATAGLVSIGIIWPYVRSNTFRVGLLAFTLLGIILFSAILLSKPPSVFENRMTYWQLGMQEVMRSPLLGYGAESGEVVFDRAFQRHNIHLLDLTVDRSHNLLLDVTIWSGITGLVVYIIWMVLLGIDLRKHSCRRFIVFLGWFVFASFQPLSVVHWLQLLAILEI